MMFDALDLAPTTYTRTWLPAKSKGSRSIPKLAI
jgi:hypothetical protein